jgi:hypothetical protein
MWGYRAANRRKEWGYNPANAGDACELAKRWSSGPTKDAKGWARAGIYSENLVDFEQKRIVFARF